MQISQIIGGYTLGGADLLRRAMGKKKPEEMAKHRASIIEGAQKKGYSPTLAERLFELMAQFAEYGFNKSHTAAYAVVTYQTAWLKAYHPAAFMAATMSSDMGQTDTIKVLYDDSRKNGLSLEGPDINASAYRFEPVDTRTIRYGLGAIKGTGEHAIHAIETAREKGGAFRDLFDFCARVDKRQVNRGTIEALILAGAFDSVDPARSKLLASVGIALDAAEQAERNRYQVSLFDSFGVEEKAQLAPQYLHAPLWDTRKRLLQEKEALGFFFSGHLYDSVRQELAQFVKSDLARLTPGRELVLIAGIVRDQRIQMTRRGKMLFVQIDDGTALVDVSIFNELYEANRNKVNTDDVLIVEGKVSHDEYANGNRVVADRLFTLGDLREARAQCVKILLDTPSATLEEETYGLRQTLPDLAQLKNILASFPGKTAVRVAYCNHRASCEFVLGENYQVIPENALLQELATWSGSKVRVRVEYG
jgi:DNA polymerase-3 subunit alpha